MKSVRLSDHQIAILRAVSESLLPLEALAECDLRTIRSLILRDWIELVGNHVDLTPEGNEALGRYSTAVLDEVTVSRHVSPEILDRLMTYQSPNGRSLRRPTLVSTKRGRPRKIVRAA